MYSDGDEEDLSESEINDLLYRDTVCDVCLKTNIGVDENDLMLECTSCGVTIHESCYGPRAPGTSFCQFVCAPCQRSTPQRLSATLPSRELRRSAARAQHSCHVMLMLMLLCLPQMPAPRSSLRAAFVHQRRAPCIRSRTLAC